MKKNVALLFALPLLCHYPLAFAAPRNPSRNPFKPKAPLETKEPQGEVPPLERYPLSDLRLTAIVADAHGDIFASVENPDGIGFKVDVGTRLGTSRARVVQITRRGLLIAEQTVNDMGTEETTMRELLLRKR